MNWHEIVNDTVDGVNVTVTYCPLYDTIIVSYVWQGDGQTPHNQFPGDSHQFVHDELQQQGS